MIEVRIVTKRNGYIFVDGALRAVKVKSETTFVDEEGDIRNEILVSDGERQWQVGVDKYFLSKYDYEKNVPCDLVLVRTSRLIGSFNEPTQILFVQGDGEIKQQLLNITRVTMEFDSKFWWNCTWTTDNPYPEDKCFCITDRDIAISWAEYDKKNADGSIEHIKGASLSVMLNDKQRKLVNKLKDTLREIKDNGVFLTMDYNQNLFAFNTENCDIEKDMGDLTSEYKSIDWLNEKFKVASIEEDLLSEYGDDYCFYLKPKGNA